MEFNKVKTTSLKKSIKIIGYIFRKNYQCLFSLAKVLLYSRFVVGIKKIKNSGSCFILGNGPSLKADIVKYIDEIKNSNTFVVNDFAKSDFYEVVKPKYYVLVDPSYWSKDVFNYTNISQ